VPLHYDCAGKPLDPAKPIVRRARYVVGEFIAEPSHKGMYVKMSACERTIATYTLSHNISRNFHSAAQQ